MRQFSCILSLLLAAAAISPAQTPAFDSSGNKLLKGVYYVREVFYLVGDGSGALGEAVSLYGNITFDGAGGYTIASQPILDSNVGRISSLTVSGTYSIAASGYGFISSPVSKGDFVYGLVSNGIFIGSSTESSFNDLLVAAPLASPQPTNASFKGSYTMNYFQPNAAAGIQFNSDAQFQLNPDGNGGLGDVAFSGYFAGGGSVAYTQTAKNVRYSFSNGGCAVFFPADSNANFIAQTEYLYFSPDGNFVFGGSPTDFDFIIGVRSAAAGTTQKLNGLFYQAGLNVDGSALGSGGFVSLDTYYGAFNVSGGSSISHERFNNPFYTTAISSTFSGTVPASISAGTYADTGAYRKYNLSSDGSIRIGLGIGPFLGISVAIQAPTFTGDGVYLNPAGVINSASFAPFTSGVSAGEFITLYGSGLAASTVIASGLPFPPTLGGVQVKINGTPAPLYYVSAGQIAAIVPYSVTGPIAAIEVINQGVESNIVTEFTDSSTPGLFSLGANGLGYGAIEHGDGSVVTAAHPAVIGETVAAFLTGLGAVSPAVTEGSAGPVSSLSQTTDNFTVLVNGNPAPKPAYTGLAPFLAGLYQVNFNIPTGAIQGDNTVEIDGPDSFAVQTLIPVSTGATALALPETPAIPSAAPGRSLRPSKRSLRPQLPRLNAPVK